MIRKENACPGFLQTVYPPPFTRDILGRGEKGYLGLQSSQHRKPLSFSCSSLGNGLVLIPVDQPCVGQAEAGSIDPEHTALGAGEVS